MKCSKCLLIFINVLYMCTSVLLVAAGTIAKIFFGKYDFLSEGTSIFTTLWIAAGCGLLVISIFGIIISFGSSTILVNMYAFALAAIVAIQISAAVAGFSISACRSKEIVSDTITSLMERYDLNDTTSREAIDWMQSKYQCCGVKGPDDWISLRAAPDDVNGNKNFPLSCCTREIDETTSKCSNYFQNGCLSLAHEMISNNVTVISLIALVIAVVQIVGVLAAYLHNKTIKKSRELEEVDYSDYSQLKTKNQNLY